MGALWGGRFEKSVGSFTQAFGASLQVDKSMYSQDIKGSLAHARMLCEKGIISKADFDKIEVGLVEIENQIAQGRFQFDINDEDIHMAIEKTLIKDVGVAGARLHTAPVTIRLPLTRVCMRKTCSTSCLPRTVRCVA